MKPEIFRPGVQKPLKQQGRKKLGVGYDAHGYVFLSASRQRVFEIGHRVYRVDNQFIFDGKPANPLSIVNTKKLLPDFIDLDFGIIDPIVF